MSKRTAVMKKLEEIFLVFDLDNNGELSYREFKILLSLANIDPAVTNLKKLCRAMSIRADGTIPYESFMDFLHIYADGREYMDRREGRLAIGRTFFNNLKDGNIAKIKKAFMAVDKDRSETLDVEELDEVFTLMGEDVYKSEVSDLFKVFDVDNSGFLTFEEFAVMMAGIQSGRIKPDEDMDHFNLDKKPLTHTIRQGAQEDTMDDEEIMRENFDNMARLERIGVNLSKEAQKHAAKAYATKLLEAGTYENLSTDAFHLTDDQKKSLSDLERGTVIADIAAGFFAGIFVAVAELLATGRWKTDGFKLDDAYTGLLSGTDRIVLFWLVVAMSGLIGTVLEMSFLYWQGLKQAMSLSAVCGLKLHPYDQHRLHILAALTRAAFELPHPNSEVMGINPLEGMPAWEIMMNGLAHKAKSGLTAFLARIMLKRVMTRLAVKSFLPFISVPINMAWNALIGYKTIRNARVIALGPNQTVDTFDGLLLNFNGFCTPDLSEALVRAIAYNIIEDKQIHPNSYVLAGQAKIRLDIAADKMATFGNLKDKNELIAATKKLPPDSQKLVLKVFILGGICRGHISSNWQTVLSTFFNDLGMPQDMSLIHRVSYLFIRGELRMEDLLMIFDNFGFDNFNCLFYADRCAIMFAV